MDLNLKLLRKYVLIVAIISTGCTIINRNVGSGILVSDDWLQEQLADSSMVILHVGTREGFDSVHIPGSRPIDPYDFTSSTHDLRNELPEMSVIFELLKSVGVNMDSRIVLYYEDEEAISRTARVFMTLDYAGIGDRTFVLNGGLPGWIEEDREVTGTGVQEVSAMTGVSNVTGLAMGDLEPGIPREVLVRAHELNQLRGDSKYVIVDTRSQDEYDGKPDKDGLYPTGGHIEGAYIMDYKTLLSDSSPFRFRDDAQLLMEFEKAHVHPNITAVYYCGSGMRASVSYLVARHLGYPALLYDGSYQDWEMLGLPLTSPVIDLPDND